MTNEFGYIFIIKTHYISARILDMWVNLLAVPNSEVHILLNDQEKLYDKQKHLVIPGSERYIHPFSVDDINRLSLPVVPHSPLWKNSWMNGDYGYYLTSLIFGCGSTLLETLRPSDIFIVQIDNDIGLAGSGWAEFFCGLPISTFDAFALGYTRDPDKSWPHLQAALKYYSRPSAMLFGMQGYRLNLLDSFYKARVRAVETLESLCFNDGISASELLEDDAFRLWPICEAFLASEFSLLNLKVFDLMKHVPCFWRHFNVTTSKWTSPISPASLSGGPFLYHPIKEPCYELKVNPS